MLYGLENNLDLVSLRRFRKKALKQATFLT